MNQNFPPGLKVCELLNYYLLQHDRTEKERTDSSVRVRVSSSKPASEQVMFTESITMVTDSEFQLPLFLERITQSFPHLMVDLL